MCEGSMDTNNKVATDGKNGGAEVNRHEQAFANQQRNGQQNNTCSGDSSSLRRQDWEKYIPIKKAYQNGSLASFL
ncbi:hypothetical protein Trydic_g8279 [Trypoxylus dichotomus]